MNSRVTADFRRAFGTLPAEIQELARKAHRLWMEDPQHPGLHFKKIQSEPPIYSVRIGIAWRAVGVLNGDEMTWFFIGSHADYDELLRRL